MRRSLLLSAMLVLLPMPLLAQEYPRAEAFGGYSYFRANPEGFNLNGWNASISGNVSPWFGIVGDFSGHYGSPSVFGFTVPFVNLSSYTFMAGPRIMARSGAVTPFAQFLIGGSRASTSSFGVTLSDDALAAAVGGGVDIRVNNWMAVRAVQADYIMTRFNSLEDRIFGANGRQNNLRISAGIVFRFGNH
jgi:hypothetical protein